MSFLTIVFVCLFSLFICFIFFHHPFLDHLTTFLFLVDINYERFLILASCFTLNMFAIEMVKLYCSTCVFFYVCPCIAKVEKVL